MNRGDHILFVGAGLSAAFGYALTREILPAILCKLRSNELFELALEKEGTSLRDEFDGLLRSFMPNILTSSPDELPAVTDVLSLIDHLVLSAQAPSPEMMTADLTRFRSLFELAICELLTRSVHPEREYKSEPLQDRLADWIVDSGTAGAPVTIITTNYDFVLEESICRRLKYAGLDVENAIDYGFTWRSTRAGSLRHRPPNPLVRFIRLHGAINWLRCRMCGFIYINPRGPTFHQADRSKDDGGNTCHCSALRLQRVIVAPSIVRRMEDADLQTVWKAALEELRLASRWVFLGYSLPHEDVAIRSIFIRALRGRTVPPHVSVYERDSSLESRFRLLFGAVSFSKAGVEDFIASLPDPSAACPTA